MPGNALPDKLFFKIGEVAQIVGVRAHVLRYWESEFTALRPMKTRGSHRVYRRRDVELAVLLRRLLHEEGLTIAGAKRRLRESGQHRAAEPSEPSVVQEVDQRAELVAMREELTELLAALHNAVRPSDDDEQAERDGGGAEPKRDVAAEGNDGADGAGGKGAASSVPVHAHKRPIV